jgi:Na+/H+ antiporter NhaC
MKKAFRYAEATGDTLPENAQGRAGDEHDPEETKKAKGIFFIIPMLVLTIVALARGDVMIGLFSGFIACIVLYLPFKVMTLAKFMNCVPEGIKSMALVMLTMTGSFVLNAANGSLGLTKYVLDTVTPIISGPFFPLITFVVLSALSFATASPWAMATVAFPIIMPLAESVGADPYMIGGALVAGTAFGSHACFYGDAAILTSASCHIQPFEYARTSIPLIILPTSVACIAYAILGIEMVDNNGKNNTAKREIRHRL